MLRFTSNAAELARDTRPSRCLRLDRRAPGAGATLGRAMAAAVAADIHELGRRGQGPDGFWRPNAPSTIDEKGKDSPNERTGAMLDPRNIAGDVKSTPRSMDMVYGTGATDDRGATDREKATLAHDGQSHLLIRRPFFALTDRTCDRLTEMAGDQYEAAAGGPAPPL